MSRIGRMPIPVPSGTKVEIQDGQFVAEGPQVVREALAAGAVLDLFVAASELDRHRSLVDAALAGGVAVHLTPDATVTALSDTTTPQGLLARCRFDPLRLDRVITPDLRLLAVLASVRDPGNAGRASRAGDCTVVAG